ncbi:unnamed protein product [Arctia plantaginis]|uniref:Uncharacterized protein n=1 Tax=Arctia plantaginis TaxID=874455 RepID=A0A8S1BND8_ARCPL|nr:unnamed protein product [Arctia plantaginis]
MDSRHGVSKRHVRVAARLAFTWSGRVPAPTNRRPTDGCRIVPNTRTNRGRLPPTPRVRDRSAFLTRDSRATTTLPITRCYTFYNAVIIVHRETFV